MGHASGEVSRAHQQRQSRGDSPLRSPAVRDPGHAKHGGRARKRHRRQHISGPADAQTRHRDEDCRSGKRVRISRSQLAQEEDRHQPQARLTQHPPQPRIAAVAATVPHLGAVLLQPRQQPRALRRFQPFGVLRAVRKHKQDHDTENDRGQRLHQEQPLPPLQPQSPVQVQEQTSHQPHQHVAQGERHVEPAHRPRPHGLGEPERKIVEDTRKEPRLRHTQQKPKRIKTSRSPHQHHRRRQNAPRQHDPRDPPPRPELQQQQVRRQLTDRIADEEHPRAKPIDPRVEVQIAVHRKLGVADVRAVHERDAVSERKQRNQPPRRLTQRPPPHPRLILSKRHYRHIVEARCRHA